MEAVFWKLRTGAPWRDLPIEFGSYSTVFNKFNRWSKHGIWQKLFLKIRGELDNEWNFIDSTIVKDHQHSVNSKYKKRECIGRSVCGNSSKMHMLSDSHGNPIDFIISEGQVHDSRCATRIRVKNALAYLISIFHLNFVQLLSSIAHQ
jgi:transposase